MASPHWRNRLVEALRRQRLPSAYVDRLVEELSDHAADLFLEDESMDAQQNVEARLGTPEQLAAAATLEYRRRTFAGRHPVATFLAGPIVAVIGTFLASILLMLAAVWLIDVATGGSLSANDAAKAPPSAFEMRVMQVSNWVVRFVPFALSAWFFFGLGRRSGLRQWSTVACGIVAVAAIFFYSVMSQNTPEGQGLWMMGFGWRQVGLDQILQAAVPLALGAWMLRQSLAGRAKALAT